MAHYRNRSDEAATLKWIFRGIVVACAIIFLQTLR